MTFGVSENPRRAAGVVLQSGAAPVAAGVLLLLAVHMPVSATPRDCVVGKARTVCLDRGKAPAHVISYTTDNNYPHPATVKGAAPVVYSPTFRPVDVDQFLPWYFSPRRSQIGVVEQGEGKSHANVPE